MALELTSSQVSLKEKDIEEYLYQHPHSLLTRNKYPITHFVLRQFTVPSGIIDLVGMSEDSEAVVVEVKNVTITSDALAQVCRYAADMERILARLPHPYVYDVHKIVVGTNITNEAMFEANALGIRVYTFAVELDLDLNGIGWTEEFQDKLRQQYDDIAQDERLDDFNCIGQTEPEEVDEATE